MSAKIASPDKEIKITCQGQKYLPIDQLKTFQGNLKELHEDEYEKLKRSILKYGFSFPVFVWQGYMLDGHQRVFTVNKLLSEGYTIGDIPVVEIEAKDKTEAAEKLLVLNSHYAKITDEGLYEFVNEMELDFESLAGDLELSDFDMDRFVEGYMKDEKEEKEDDIPGVLEDPVTKQGDLWLLGEHRFLCGDATKKEGVERLMDGKKADMVFTDPPYGINLDADYRKMPTSPTGAKPLKHRKVIGDEQEFDPSFLLERFLYCDDILLFGADYYCKVLPKSGLYVWDKRVTENFDKMIGSAFELIWSKKKRKREIARFNNTLYSGESDATNKVHPTQKPIKLIEWFFDRIVGNIVVDPFLGSGSTLIACEKTSRVCYGIEIDPHYCDVILQRWADYTGKDPAREDGVSFSQLKAEKYI